ncbi:MAG TPA: hypothetical protein VFS40_03130 [Gemmatimonadales bacterium]|nr:hypothetical protein [Gemmatimonadales bacterium]
MRSWWIAVPMMLAAACSNDSVGPGGGGAPPPVPQSLTSTSLDGAVALTWSDNSYTSNPDRFLAYRIYSTSYDLDNDRCGGTFSLEGTTVAPEFVVGALVNGRPRCFAVTAEGTNGAESARSDLRADTPRPDSRNVVLYTRQSDPTRSGFRFWQDLNGNGSVESNELGLVGSGNASDIDFSVDRDPSGTLFLTPVRSGTSVALYGSTPTADLTSIDVAPVNGYAATPIEAKPGWGYVFQMAGGDGFARYGGVRVTHVGPTLIIFDWSFQTDPGNPELRFGRK